MAEIADPIFEVGTVVSVAPIDGIVGAIADDGSVVVTEAWDNVQGDSIHTAPAGSAVGGGTRRHLFDREVYVDTVGDGSGYVNVRAYTSITGKPTTVQGYGITNAIRTDLGATQNIDNALTVALAVTITTNATYFTGKTAGAVSKRLIGVNAGGLVAIDADAVGTTFGAGAAFSGAITTATDNANDVGASSFRFRHGYFSGTVTTASITYTSNLIGTRTSGAVLSNTGNATTGTLYVVLSNTAGNAYFGVEDSTGGGLFPGTTANAVLLGAVAAKPVQLISSNAVVATFNSTGAIIPGKVAVGDTAVDSQAGIYTLGTYGLRMKRDGGTASTRGNMLVFHSNIGYSGGTGADSIFTADWGVAFQVNAQSAAATAAYFTNAGHLFAGTDNAYDMGGTSNRFRNGYFAGNIQTGGKLTVNGSTSSYALDVNATSGTVGVRVASNTSGDIWFYGTGTITGSATFFNGAMSATTGITGSIANQSTAAGASAILAVSVNGATASDPYLAMTVSGVTSWSVGIDNSVAGDPLVFSAGGSPGSSDVVSITTAGAITSTTGTNGTTNLTLSGSYAGSGTVDLLVFQRTGGAVAGRIRYDDAATGMRFGTSSAHNIVLERGGTGIATLSSSAILATTDASYDVGGTSNRFRHGYFSGTILTASLGVGTLPIAPSAGGILLANGKAISSVNIDNVNKVHLISTLTANNIVLVAGDGDTVRMPAYGAGNAVFDGSGNISSSSDERLKDILEPFTVGLSGLRKLEPTLYRWNALSNMETEGTYAGFRAQNAKEVSEYAVGVDAKGYYSLQDRAILAVIVNSVKELDGVVEGHTTRLDDLERFRARAIERFPELAEAA